MIWHGIDAGEEKWGRELVWVAGDGAMMARGRRGQGISSSVRPAGAGDLKRARWEKVGRGSVVGISLLFFSKTREMACGWEVEFGQKKTNGVSLDVGWKMIYSVI
jgi:hypothetical protein